MYCGISVLVGKSLCTQSLAKCSRKCASASENGSCVYHAPVSPITLCYKTRRRPEIILVPAPESPNDTLPVLILDNLLLVNDISKSVTQVRQLHCDIIKFDFPSILAANEVAKHRMLWHHRSDIIICKGRQNSMCRYHFWCVICNF